MLLLLWLILNLLCTASPAPAAGPPAPPSDILLLHSYHQGLSWSDGITAAVMEEFAAADSAEIHVEYLDAKRYPHEQNSDLRQQFYRARFADRHFDVIIACDNYALEFVRNHRRELFPATPVVFCGINHFRDELIDTSGWYTGVLEKTSPGRTIELMRQLHPGLQRCAVIGDHTVTGRAELAAAREVLGTTYDDIAISYWENPAPDDLAEKLHRLRPEIDAVLLTVLNRDAAGNYYTYETSGRFIAAQAPCPVYGLWDFYLGTGVVGGHMTSARDQGQLAARLAQRILAGEAPADIPIIRESPNRDLFDIGRLDAFGIRLSDLPDNARAYEHGRLAYEAGGRQTIRLGVLANRGRDRGNTDWGPTADYLTKNVPGCRFKLVPLAFDEVEAAVNQCRIDLLITNPSQFAELDIIYACAPLATREKHYGDSSGTVYGSVILCRADRDDIEVLADLRGKRFAAVAPESFGGWLMVRRELKRHDLDPFQDFTVLRFTNSCDAVIQAVIDGTADAGCIRSDALVRLQHEGIARVADFRIINPKHDADSSYPLPSSTALYPEWPLIRLPHVPQILAQQVAGVLIGMPAATADGNSWTVPMSYQPVHECLMELGLGPYKGYGDVTFTALLRRYWRWLLPGLLGLVALLAFAIHVSRLNHRIRGMAADLIENRNRLNATLYSIGDAVIATDKTGQITDMNAVAEVLTGWSLDEARSRPLDEVFRIVDGHTREPLANPARHVLATAETVELANNTVLLARTGAERLIADSAAPIRRTGGAIIGVVLVFRDVSAQKQAEKELLAEREALEHKQTELAQAKEWLENTNNALEESIARANQMAVEAEYANITKSQFLANMSHEIRTPMNGVIGMTGLLLDTDLTPDQRHYTETIQSSGNALLDLINDILDFSKIEANRMELEELDFDLRSALDEFAELLAVRAQEKDLELVCGIDPDVPSRLRGDPGRLRQILINLTGNAIKFTAAGEVAIRVTREAAADDRITLRFAVRDTGIGIPEDKLHLLFGAFQQVDASTTRRFGGTGLGLAISKRLAEMMGGEIGVESKVGTGSTFWFTAVLRHQPAAAIMEAPPRPASLAGVHVLIVDDNATNREVLSLTLKTWGMRHEVTASGDEALVLLERARDAGDAFTLAILDMQMPEMDGEELGREIRRRPALAATRLVMMSSVGRRGDAARLAHAGFAAYLTKPVKQKELHDCLATVVGDTNPLPANAESPHRNIVTRHSVREDQRTRFRILLAEDNIINQKVALKTLEKLGYRADAVANGEEALKAVEQGRYDVVLMDVQMPVMDGFEATAVIRGREVEHGTERLPIIAMTAHAMKGDRERCLEQGMDDYVSKPVRPDMLQQALERWLPPAPRSADPVVSATTGEDNHRSAGQKPGNAPAVKPPAAAVWNRELLRKRLMNDDELMADILGTTREELPLQLDRMASYIAAGDLAAAERQAHSLKGAAANLGADALRATAEHMERTVKNAPAAEQNEQLARLKQDVDQLLNTIARYLEQIGWTS
ncbi:MAG: response regulator [Deltaproteobacteria bacterium]|nr:response regulator [Candidatus Anaeroferrophillacea bacterium]